MFAAVITLMLVATAYLLLYTILSASLAGLLATDFVMDEAMVHRYQFRQANG